MITSHTRCDCCYNWVDKECKIDMLPCNMQNMCTGWVTDAYRKYYNKNVCWNCSNGEMDRSGLYCHLHKEMRDTSSTCESFKMDKGIEENYKAIKTKYLW